MKKLTILILSMMFLQVNAQITSYNINSTITCTDTIQPFGTHTISYGLSIDGEGQLLSDTAFIRVVLVDKNDNDYDLKKSVHLKRKTSNKILKI